MPKPLLILGRVGNPEGSQFLSQHIAKFKGLGYTDIIFETSQSYTLSEYKSMLFKACEKSTVHESKRQHFKEILSLLSEAEAAGVNINFASRSPVISVSDLFADSQDLNDAGERYIATKLCASIYEHSKRLQNTGYILICSNNRKYLIVTLKQKVLTKNLVSVIFANPDLETRGFLTDSLKEEVALWKSMSNDVVRQKFYGQDVSYISINQAKIFESLVADLGLVDRSLVKEPYYLGDSFHQVFNNHKFSFWSDENQIVSARVEEGVYMDLLPLLYNHFPKLKVITILDKDKNQKYLEIHDINNNPDENCPKPKW